MNHQPAPTKSWGTNAVRQLKLVIPGALGVYYLGIVEAFLQTLHGLNGSLARTGAFTAGGLGLTTVGLFFYILLLPVTTGEEPDYRLWRESPVLSSTIPVLTTTIVSGWLIAVTVLGQWSGLGYLKGIVGVSSAYALTFGLLGLIPTPKSKRKPRD
ncbi:hypothetical protein BKA70DRAFT_1261831 [Coprinopsis sp. MPI-PUGE-AT-0042]|nr:hypothetical protein BKA70DRAFT_1261831 [Coprinopsis sp. MPI-PUGE-AT-0042]